MEAAAAPTHLLSNAWSLLPIHTASATSQAGLPAPAVCWGRWFVTIYLPQSPPTPIRVVLQAQAGQQSPGVVPAGEVLDPGVCVSVGQHRGGGWAARDAQESAGLGTG